MTIKSAVICKNNKSVTVGIDTMGRVVIFKSKNYDNKGNFSGSAIYLSDNGNNDAFYYAGYDSAISPLSELEKAEIDSNIQTISLQ